MAISEHLTLLKKGVASWNVWRRKNPQIRPDLIEADLSGLKLMGANLAGTDLVAADLSSANLGRANFSGSNLSRANLSKANLFRANLCNCNLSNANLSDAELIRAEFVGAELNGANLNRADISGAELMQADLTAVQALGASFHGANLTGACIQDWNINSATELDETDCEYIYFQRVKYERRPYLGNFNPGEFSKLIQKSPYTIDLIFRSGVDWFAFAHTFKKVTIENHTMILEIHSIENKDDGVIVVRLKAGPNVDKTKIHTEIMGSYELDRKIMQAKYGALDNADEMIGSKKSINFLFDLVNELRT